jgi:hypothetical protein
MGDRFVALPDDDGWRVLDTQADEDVAYFKYENNARSFAAQASKDALAATSPAPSTTETAATEEDCDECDGSHEQRCPKCEGFGHGPNEGYTCRECDGTGKRPVYSAGEEMVAGFKPCPACAPRSPEATGTAALALTWYQRDDGLWNADCACGSTLCGYPLDLRAEGERRHPESRRMMEDPDRPNPPCGPCAPRYASDFRRAPQSGEGDKT